MSTASADTYRQRDSFVRMATTQVVWYDQVAILRRKVSQTTLARCDVD